MIDPYPLPENILVQIVGLADEADGLFIGEIHGTQEIPILPLLLVQLGLKVKSLFKPRRAEVVCMSLP